MKNIINKISRAVQVVLLAPIKLPGKALNILKYVAVGLGIIESVLDNGKPETETGDQDGFIPELQPKDRENPVAGNSGAVDDIVAVEEVDFTSSDESVERNDDASVVPEQVVHFAQSAIVRPNTATETEERDE